MAQQQAQLFHLSDEVRNIEVQMYDRRVVLFETTLSLAQLESLMNKIKELTQSRSHKVVVSLSNGWVLMSCVEDTMALSLFIEDQHWKRNPYAPRADINQLMQFFRPASVHSGVRCASHALRCVVAACVVPIPAELLVRDADGAVSRPGTKTAVEERIAQACGVYHSGWLNANTTIVFRRGQPVTVVVDSPESAARLSDVWRNHEPVHLPMREQRRA